MLGEFSYLFIAHISATNKKLTSQVRWTAAHSASGPLPPARHDAGGAWTSRCPARGRCRAARAPRADTISAMGRRVPRSCCTAHAHDSSSAVLSNTGFNLMIGAVVSNLAGQGRWAKTNKQYLERDSFLARNLLFSRCLEPVLPCLSLSSR